jgi:hypothetical protein
MLIELYGWLLDRRRYGIGIMWNRWTQETGVRTVREAPKINIPILGIELQAPETTRKEEYLRYEGNDSEVVDPFNFGWDPRVTAARVQKGEFVYRIIRRSFSYMKDQEAVGFYKQVNRIPRLKGESSLVSTGPNAGSFVNELRGQISDREKIVDLAGQFTTFFGNSQDFLDKGYVELTEMVCKITDDDMVRYMDPNAPAQLAGGTYPDQKMSRSQMYWCTLANDAVIVRFEPYDYDHQQFPVSLMESHPDPHSPLNISSVEEMAELQKFANWLYRSRAEHVIRTLNGQYVVDPSKVHIEDILNPQPGGLIRLRPEAFQIPGVMKDALMQLPIMDVTKGHIGEIQNVMNFLERLSGATEPLQGVTKQGDTTLGEQQMALQSAGGRLKVQAQLAWTEGMVPWVWQRIQNAQQLLSEERYMRIVGGVMDAMNLPPEQRFVRVNGDDIRGEFDIAIIDGVVRGDGQLQQMWTQIFQSVVNSPQLAMQYDINGLFKFLAYISGVKNLGDFDLQKQPIPPTPGTNPADGIQAVPDEQLAREAEKGNVIPANEAFQQSLAGSV